HKDTVKLKKDLETLGYGKFIGNTSYGPSTKKAVEKLQRNHKLVVNGIADEVTLKKISQLIKEHNKPSVDPNNLKNGDRHPKVVELKRDLAKAGFPVAGTGNQAYGPKTETQVKAFQRYYGLSADGVAGKATFTKLSSVVNSPLQNGKKHKDTVKLKKDLETLGYGKFIGNTSYGPSTKKAVEKLQRDHKLVVNGIADEVTLKKISQLIKEHNKPSVDPNNLKNGDRHPKVVELKRDLAKAGFPVAGTGNQAYGPKTETQVKAFQRYYGLSADGVAGKATFTKLG